MPAWLFAILIVVGILTLFYGYVKLEEVNRRRRNNRVIKKMQKELFGE